MPWLRPQTCPAAVAVLSYVCGAWKRAESHSASACLQPEAMWVCLIAVCCACWHGLVTLQWCSQGVLLLNAALTVRAKNSNSHAGVWLLCLLHA